MSPHLVANNEVSGIGKGWQDGGDSGQVIGVDDALLCAIYKRGSAHSCELSFVNCQINNPMPSPPPQDMLLVENTIESLPRAETAAGVLLIKP